MALLPTVRDDKVACLCYGSLSLLLPLADLPAAAPVAGVDHPHDGHVGEHNDGDGQEEVENEDEDDIQSVGHGKPGLSPVDLTRAVPACCMVKQKDDCFNSIVSKCLNSIVISCYNWSNWWTLNMKR